MFAVVGLLLYGGRFDTLSRERGGYQAYLLDDANFNSFESSLTVMSQLLIGEGWSDIMFAAVDARGGDVPHALFFVSYVFFCGVVATNLFIGIICEAFERLQVNGRQRTATWRMMRCACAARCDCCCCC